MASRSDIESYLGALLDVGKFRDYGPNGLQIEGKPEVKKLVSGVTASRALIEAAIDQQADAILVHHGLFWRGHDGRLTGWLKARVELLMTHGINLYAYHLPLDAQLTIVLASIGGWLLGMRNMMVSTLSEDYVLTAEAKGLAPRKVLRSYASRNAVLPSIAGFAISLGFVVSGSVITEQVFSYPGIGGRLLGAVTNNDYALMQGVFLFITLAVLGANLVVDMLYGVIDPRTRARS